MQNNSEQFWDKEPQTHPTGVTQQRQELFALAQDPPSQPQELPQARIFALTEIYGAEKLPQALPSAWKKSELSWDGALRPNKVWGL